MSDETHVTDGESGGTPTMDDLADVMARTNRGILVLEDMISGLSVAMTAGFAILFALVARLLIRVKA